MNYERAKYAKLLEPLEMRHKTLRNRIVFGAHTANMAEGGLPGERHLGYYLERARGGAGMIVVEPMPVHPTAVLTRGNFKPCSDEVIPGFRRITEVCKAEGATMLQQIYHVGQHGDYDLSYQPNWSPSGLPSFHDGDGSHRMSESEIETLIDCFVQAAIRARACGFEGVEIFGAYNSLLEQFWLPWNNRRDDRWGGTLENRMRFTTEMVSRIRKAAGDEFIIGIASSIERDVNVGLKVEELQEIASYLDDRALIDYISVGTGSYFDHSSTIPGFLNADKLGAPNAEALKAVCKHIRVQAESHIRTPENANEVITSGGADLVSIVRGQIADPHWVNKVAQNRDTDVRGCISCNQMCWGRRSRDYWISCLVNPSAGREFEWGGDSFTAADKSKRLLVVGGGPAGLEAARVAAERGHSVTLVEASSKLGGQFRLAGLQHRRSQILELIEWYERQFERLDVKVQFNSPVDGEDILSYEADEVIVATGSLPAETGFQRVLPELERLPGAEKKNVFSVEDVMTNNAKLGGHVLVLDDTGDWRGLGTAMHIASRGHRVSVVTGWPLVGQFLPRTLSDNDSRARVKASGGSLLTETAITEWTDSGARLRSVLDRSESFIEADTLILATTNISEDWIMAELENLNSAQSKHLIGDAMAPRLAVAAIYEGRVLGQAI
ncbi:FAD-dependent oxidoreductase [Paracoccus saliphilus]|uniref:2,4-dienoyl-CoA reductase n=1 Tax=Paracoccus saliphilus TaxID=405559 RepID=A0AA45W6Z2_9RHOB|nr:FAD-dependent oxidoreductase [Paracoccus saliphilus]WCR03858.1 FAD-dependent oxidoreductase [Paracoccus saliphilus]SIT05477.1 2,4-dienoyl-CoA reductase [Paracoccus saliphilus]